MTDPSPPPVITPLVAAALAAGGVWGTWRLFVGSARGQVFDELALRGSNIGAWRLDDQFLALLDVVSTPTLALAMLLALMIAALRREWAAGVAAAIALAGANLTTQFLKYVILQRPHFAGDGVPDLANTLPSGHTTVAASVMFALLMVVPPWARWGLAYLAATIISAFGFATLVNQWHRPSDTIAAVLVVAAWSFAAMTVLRLLGRVGERPLVRSSPGVAFVVLLLLGVIALGVAGFCGYVTWNVQVAEAARTTLFAAYAGGVALLGATTAASVGMLLAMLNGTRRSAAVRPGMSVPTQSPAQQSAG